MKHCPTHEPLIAELLFGELDDPERQRLEAHLDACAACRATVREAQTALQATAARVRPEPPPAFWDGYYDRLAARMAAGERPSIQTNRVAGWRQKAARFVTLALVGPPRRAMHLAAALALLAVGVLIGWLVFSPTPTDAPRVAETPEGIAAPVQTASLEARADRYLERSKVLLLGLVNLEPAQQEPALPNLSRQRDLARELLDESGPLKTDLNAANQRLLRGLIDDLEVILLQIANLEADYDLPAIEMVQRGVDQRAILLKINVTEMRRAAAPGGAAAGPLRPDSSTF